VDVNGSSQSDGERGGAPGPWPVQDRPGPTHCGHAPERPSTANDRCQQPTCELEASAGFEPASNARDTLVMHR
jgi:hypothetical protein